ncbi:N-acetyltransferase [Pseudophaeobacter sp.]|uniref:GNAT family N-acetyltransferase n=1 Tax=Pseudophaeobacter sp. TaxID=1971739 RepID=UPI0032969D60
MVEFYSGYALRERAICDLFTSTFSDSEGPEEGAVIGGFVNDMMNTTPNQDLFVWSAYDDEDLIGCIFFSRLVFEQDDRVVFIMSPVAVKTDRQGTGIGQELIGHGLSDLRQKGIDFVATYGDPKYYCKTGFRQITEEFAQAPLKLSFPEGWLGQSLSGAREQPLLGASCCVPALNKPELW